MTFAEALAARGLTAARVARETGTPLGTVRGWCQGRRRTPEIAFRWLELAYPLPDTTTPPEHDG